MYLLNFSKESHPSAYSKESHLSFSFCSEKQLGVYQSGTFFNLLHTERKLLQPKRPTLATNSYSSSYYVF